MINRGDDTESFGPLYQVIRDNPDRQDLKVETYSFKTAKQKIRDISATINSKLAIFHFGIQILGNVNNEYDVDAKIGITICADDMQEEIDFFKV